MVLPSVAIALSWRSLDVSSPMLPLPALFGAMLLFTQLFVPTFALIPFAPPLPPFSSGRAASPLLALFGCGAVSLMSSSIQLIGHQLIRCQDVIFDETRSPFLTPPPTPPTPSLHWSDFDPRPSVAPSATPSPPPLPPAPAPPLPPAPSAPPSAVTSGNSPPASSSSAPMPSPSPLPDASLPSVPLPPPSPRLTRSMTRAMSNFQHSALFTRLSSSRDPNLLEDQFEELFSVHLVSPLLYVTIDDFSNSPTLLSADTAAIPIPQSYSEAVSSFHATEWMAAIIAKCEAFTRTNSYVDSVPPLAPVYGLKQAPREWHAKAASTPHSLGFSTSTSDPSLFIRTSPHRLYILAYVDDLMLLAEDSADLAAVKKALQARLLCKDLGELRHYLGMEIRRDRAARTISLSQSFYIHSILQRFEMSQAKSVSTPLPFNHQLTAPAVLAPSSELRPYPELVGSLMYAMMCTRPDLAYPLSVLSRFVGLGRYTDVHWAAAKRVLHYLRSTSDLALTLGGSSPRCSFRLQ
ncbi:unnamed protein product [Closterium sp. NIES-54]